VIVSLCPSLTEFPFLTYSYPDGKGTKYESDCGYDTQRHKAGPGQFGQEFLAEHRLA